jgi:hypothetical protein
MANMAHLVFAPTIEWIGPQKSDCCSVVAKGNSSAFHWHETWHNQIQDNWNRGDWKNPNFLLGTIVN